MIKQISFTRRYMVAATSAALAQPAVTLMSCPAAAKDVATATKIGKLWSDAEALQDQMAPYAEVAATLGGRAGLPSWMHLSGTVNQLGHRRYDTLVTILKTPPASLDDLAIMGAATREPEFRNGPASWAHSQFDEAAKTFHRRG